MIIILARLGGYLARNHDPPPGPPMLWEGFTALAQHADAYETLAGLQRRAAD